MPHGIFYLKIIDEEEIQNNENRKQRDSQKSTKKPVSLIY